MCQHSGRYEIDERGHPDEEWKTTSELKISRLEKTDLGEYTCSASSSMGKAEATLRVYGESAHTYTIDEHCHFSTTAIPWKIPLTLTSRDSCPSFEPSTRITNKLRYRTLYNVHVPSFVFARESKNAPLHFESFFSLHDTRYRGNVFRNRTSNHTDHLGQLEVEQGKIKVCSSY